MAPATLQSGIPDEQRALLERWAGAHKTPQSVALRARIVLLATAGESNSAIARRLSVSRPTVILWRERFQTGGPQALTETRPGRRRKPTISAAKIKAIVAATTQTTPPCAFRPSRTAVPRQAEQLIPLQAEHLGAKRRVCLAKVGVLFGFRSTRSARRCSPAHRFTREFDAHRAVHEPVEHRIGDARVSDQVVPVADRQLAGDDRRAHPGAVVDHVHEVVGGLALDLGEAPVVEHEQIDPGELLERLQVAAVGPRQGELEDELRHAAVEGRAPAPERPVGERAGEVGLPQPGGAGDDHVTGLPQEAELAELEEGRRGRDRGWLRKSTSSTEASIFSWAALSLLARRPSSRAVHWRSTRRPKRSAKQSSGSPVRPASSEKASAISPSRRS